MSWFYEVEFMEECPNCGETMLKTLQGKNSDDDYEGHYMETGQPLFYKSLDDLMPNTHGGIEDINFIGECDSCETFPRYIPMFFNGRWCFKLNKKETE